MRAVPATPHDELADGGFLEDEARFDTAMITRLDEARTRSLYAIERLTTAFTAMLCGILVMLCGLALAALVG